jgi:energy-coupling factor transporter ATP-binding protein EcfA2
MILRRLELRSFGRFRQEAFAFAPGMNLVLGPNESGKSMLLEAVPAVLFGVRDARRFVPWGDDDCGAALVLETSGRTVRIERDLLADRVTWSEQGAAGFQLCFSGHVGPDGPAAERAEYHDRLRQLLCTVDQEVLRMAFWFDPHDLFANDPKRLARVLRNALMETDGIDYHRVLETLRQDYLAVTRDNPWGLEADGEGRLEELGRQLEGLEKRWFATQQSRRDLVDLERRIARMEAVPDGLADGGACSSSRSEPPLSMEPPASPETASPETAGRRQELEAELAKTGLPRDIPAELPDLLAQAGDIRQKLAELQRQVTARREEFRRHGPPPWRLMVAILVVLWTGLVFWVVEGGWSGFPILIGLIVTAVAGGWHGRRWWGRRITRRRIEEQIRILESEQKQVREQRKGLDERFEKCGFAISAVEMVRMQKNLPRHRRLREALARLEEAREAEEKKVTPAVVPFPNDVAGGGTAMQPPAGQPDELNARRDVLRRELATCRQIEARGDYLRARETHLLQRRDVLGTACEMLHGAMGEYGGSRLDRFAVTAGEHLKQLTAGRYAEIRLTADFEIQLGGPAGQWQPVDRFSGAVRHVVQLAVRLALGRQLVGEAGPPLLLDDMLLTLDKKHRDLLLQTLRQLGDGRQVVLCSHDETLRGQADHNDWHVVTLAMSRGDAAGQALK